MLPFTRAMFIHRSNIHKQFLKGSSKENSCEIISKFDHRFRRRRFFKDFLRISSCPYSARSPHHQSHVYGGIRILRTIFETGQLRNIPMKLFQNRTNGFQRRRFFKNFFMSIKWKKSPPPWRPCFSKDQNFENTF